MSKTDSRNILLNIFSESSDGIACVDMDGNFLFTNESFAGMTGYSACEMKSKNINQMLIDEDSFRKLLMNNNSNCEFSKKKFIKKSGEVKDFQTRFWRQQSGINESTTWFLIKEVSIQKETDIDKNNFYDLNLVQEITEALKEHFKVINGCLINLQQDFGGEIKDSNDYISHSLKYCTKIQDLIIKLVSSGKSYMVYKPGFINKEQIEILTHLN